MEKEKALLNLVEKIMAELKPLSYRERKAILKNLEILIDVDTWYIPEK